jgi:hypothetical protein
MLFRMCSRTSGVSGHGVKQYEDRIEICVRHLSMEKNTREPAKFLTVKVTVLWGNSRKRSKFLGKMSNRALTTLQEKQSS